MGASHVTEPIVPKPKIPIKPSGNAKLSTPAGTGYV